MKLFGCCTWTYILSRWYHHSFQCQLYRQFYRSVLTIFNIYCLVDNFSFIPTIACFTIYFAVRICYLFVMTADYVFCIVYTIITNSELLPLRILWYLWFLTKCLSNKYYTTFNVCTNIGPNNILILLTFHFLLIF